jgi:hypothetical protein
MGDGGSQAGRLKFRSGLERFMSVDALTMFSGVESALNSASTFFNYFFARYVD